MIASRVSASHYIIRHGGLPGAPYWVFYVLLVVAVVCIAAGVHLRHHGKCR